MIHTTIGIYPDGSYKVNGVREDNLEQHIQYNKTYRPGRILIVDGKLIHSGCIVPEYLDRILATVPIEHIKIGRDTAPYH